MGTNARDGSLPGHRFGRRGLIRAGIRTASALAAGGLLPTARAAPSARQTAPAAPAAGPVVFLSTQLTPEAEAAAMRDTILADFPGAVEFTPAEPGPFVERVVVEGRAAPGTVGVLGALHGDFATFAKQGLLVDLSDLATQLGYRGFIAPYLELGRLGGPQLHYLPWMQATFVMVARREALEYLPAGLDARTLPTALTYDLLAAWAERIAGAAGPKLGFPAGPLGLIHRFLQGYAYPSFTGGVNTTFAGDDAVALWGWLKDVWRFVNPRSIEYEAMAAPLLAGDVWLAWDHTARLIAALRQQPNDFVAFPAPRGPRGLGFMPVVAGLAIPKSAPDPVAARALIEYLTRPEIQTRTLQEVAFFPAVEAQLSTDLDPGILAEAAAVQQTATAEAALPALPPVGLGEQNVAYNTIFRDAFREIVLDGGDVAATLAAQATRLQAALDAAQAACWTPDPPSRGICRVG